MERVDPNAPGDRRNGVKTLLAVAQAAAIVGAGLWVFAPAMRGEWIWDDRPAVSENALMRDPAGLHRIWFAPPTPDYFPLTTTVQWAEWRLWGDDRLAYHLTSVGLHLLSALLFWRLLRRLFGLSSGSGWSGPGEFGAWLGGLFFAVHPLAVESVAWISELKNTLSLPPLLLAMIAWVKYDGGRCPPSGGRRPPGDGSVAVNLRATATSRHYILALFCFLVSLLAKSSVVMFPVVLLLYAWWRRGRIARADVRASLPFFVLSLGFGWATVWFQLHRTFALESVEPGGIATRLAAAGLAIPFYLGKCVLPFKLAPIYPRWRLDPPSAADFLPWIALAAALAALWARRHKRWGRAALFGLGFFLVNLAPVLGVVPMAYNQISWVGDHLAYLPILGPLGLAAAGIAALLRRAARRPIRAALAAAAAALAVCLMGQSRGYAAIYADNPGFWRYALQRSPDAWIAHNDYGVVLSGEGRLPEAIAEFREALRLRPDYPDAHNDLGNALARSRRLPEAIAQFREALRLRPGYLDAEYNLGDALSRTGRFAAAVAQYEEIARLRPDDPQSHLALGFALFAARRLPEAIGQFQEAVRLRPQAADLRFDLAMALRDAGREEEADAERREAEALRVAHP